MAGASADRKLYKSLLIFPQHWSRGNSNQEHYYVLIQKSYTEAKSCYINSIYKLLHWQVYVTEQHGRALLTSCMCECTCTHASVYTALLQRCYFTSLKSPHFGYRNRELPTLWTRSVLDSASAPVHSCPSWLAATVVTCTLSHSASAICLALSRFKSFSCSHKASQGKPRHYSSILLIYKGNITSYNSFWTLKKRKQRAIRKQIQV